ncbi:MAG: DUF2813 domain-containing protein [Candidatus Malihini olakiniferum]
MLLNQKSRKFLSMEDHETYFHLIMPSASWILLIHSSLQKNHIINSCDLLSLIPT